jgi:hypothetical protein
MGVFFVQLRAANVIAPEGSKESLPRRFHPACQLWLPATSGPVNGGRKQLKRVRGTRPDIDTT